MTILSIAMAIFKTCGQILATEEQILAEQKALAQQNTALQTAVNALSEEQRRQGAILDEILQAVKGPPVGVTARIVLDTPIPQ